MVRVTSSTMVPGSSIYSYLDIDGLGTNATSSNYSLAGGVTSAYNWDNYNCTSTLKWWENGVGHDITSGSGSYEGYTDMQLASYSPFSVPRTNVTRYITFECYTTCPGGNGSATYQVEVPHLPGAPTSLSATRISDNRIDLTWTNPSSTYGGFYLQVSIDGGAWSTAWSVENVMPTSYSYTAASAGHSYKFRAYTGYWYAYSSYSNETATISMTPTAPQSIAVAAVSGTTVEVTLTNPSPVATKVQYQVSTDGGSTWGATQESANLTTFQTTVTGTGKIRVRNYNSTGTSSWLVSSTITTITPPAAPTLTAPAGSIIDLALGSVDFEWVFNSLDGSAQTAYEFSLSKNGGAATVTSGTTAKKVTQSLSSFAAGDTITIKVRTKGADANWGAWSSTKTYNVYSAPTLSITSPSATVTGMPISLAATYSDMAGFSCVYAHVSLTQGGRVLFDEDATISGSSITASLDVSEFLPNNGESYTVVLEVRSSSSLQASANATFLVDFTEPVDGSLSVENDPDTGYASLLATYDNTGADEPAVSISVARVNPDGSLTPLITDGASGAGVLDRYAPLNKTYQYAVTTKAASQAVKTVYVDNEIVTDLWFAYWGENIASAKWNPDNGGIQLSRPQKTRVFYAGRKDPVSYDGAAVALSETPSWMLVDRDEKQPFIQLIEDGGRGVYKSCDGWVYHADFDLTLNPKYTAIGYYGGMMLSITRIAGEQL